MEVMEKAHKQNLYVADKSTAAQQDKLQNLIGQYGTAHQVNAKVAASVICIIQMV